MKQKDYIFSPYIHIKHTDESLKEYNEFIKEYHKLHECCPKCGGIEHTSTLFCYVLDLNNKHNYKDMNICECKKCGDKHYVHNRVPAKKK